MKVWFEFQQFIDRETDEKVAMYLRRLAKMNRDLQVESKDNPPLAYAAQLSSDLLQQAAQELDAVPQHRV